ncbi:MAG: helix-turn-helix domain-containing protein, partial [Firmicutes bacterium]|nr:helix-turn-helix domain-containing protein [Bacillota bacterium]
GKYQEWLEPDGLILLQGWAREGLTEEQIAHNMGISRETLRVWKKKYSGISVALKKGKAVVDFAVENALLKKALGGDTTAQIFWLKNRKPDVWRDRQEQVHSGTVPVTIIDDVGIEGNHDADS